MTEKNYYPIIGYLMSAEGVGKVRKVNSAKLEAVPEIVCDYETAFKAAQYWIKSTDVSLGGKLKPGIVYICFGYNTFVDAGLFGLKGSITQYSIKVTPSKITKPQ